MVIVKFKNIKNNELYVGIYPYYPNPWRREKTFIKLFDASQRSVKIKI